VNFSKIIIKKIFQKKIMDVPRGKNGAKNLIIEKKVFFPIVKVVLLYWIFKVFKLGKQLLVFNLILIEYYYLRSS